MDFRGQDSHWFTQPPPQLAIPHPFVEVNNMAGNELSDLSGKVQGLLNANNQNFETLQHLINQKFIALEQMLSQMVETLVDAIEQLSLSLSAEISALREKQDQKRTDKACAALQPNSKEPEMQEAGTSSRPNAKKAKNFAELESAVFGSVIDVNSNSDSDGTDNDTQDVDGDVEDEEDAMETEEKPSKTDACRTSNRVAKKPVKKNETRGRKLGRRNKTESKASIKEKLMKLQAEKEAGAGGFGKPSLSVRDEAQGILNSSKRPINWMTRRCILSYFTCLEPEEGLEPIGEKDHILKLLNEEIDDKDVKLKLLDILNMHS